MIPKEKAIELFDKFDSILFKEYNNLEAKKCASIAVDEIRDNLPLISDIQQYWIDVKQEIENI